MTTVSSTAKHRRALHRIPELDHSLPKTKGYIEAELTELGCEVFSPFGCVVCGYIDRGAEHTIAFRADMDALPIGEKTGLSFASEHKGCMHACGHDGHMAMVLELGRRLMEKNSLRYNILLVFQPAEETTGGAKPICETGLFEKYKVKAIFGLHLWPGLKAGSIAGLPGPMMARSGEVTFTAEGRSVHLCKKETGLGALAACVDFYAKAMELDKRLPADVCRLMGFGRMEAGSVRNATAASAVLEGSLRALEDKVFFGLRDGLSDICENVALSSGCKTSLRFSEGYPPVNNPLDMFDKASKLFNIDLLPEPTMISEDFSWYQRHIPGLFLLLGCGPAPELHSADFNFDESVLETGVSYFEAMAEGTEW